MSDDKEYKGIDDFYRRLKEIQEQQEKSKVVSLDAARKKKEQEKSKEEVTPELSIDDRIDALFSQVEQRNREHKERLEKERLEKNKKTLQEYRIFPKGDK